jgi:hypothetical protein
VDRLDAAVRYKNPVILYRNSGRGMFEDVSDRGGAGLRELHSARGAAFGDIDNDGAVEVLINNQNEPPTLLKQSAPPAGHWIVLKLEGTKSNRSAIGARVRLTAGGRSQVDEVRSGGSYLSQSDLRLHFGLGSAKVVDLIEVQWPSGRRQRLERTAADRVIRIAEN